MIGRNVRFAVVRRFGVVVPLLIALACDRETTSPSRDVQVSGVRAAKAPSGPSVSSANPPYGDQGTTLDVQVIGSGFTQGATATWLLNGVANGHVHTNSTTFNSSTQLTANITIDPDAQLAFWDVQVALAGGKNGVGSDAFEVTSAMVLSTQSIISIQGTNNLGDVVGYTQNDAFVYTDATGFADLGPHQGRALDPDAHTAFGADGINGNAIAWTLGPDGTWTHELLPAAPNSIGRFVTSAARMADGTLLAGGVDGIAAGRNGSNNRPVVWRRSGSTWSAPTIYAYPAGVTSAFARTVNALGEVGGQLDGTTGAIWDDPTTVTLIDGWPNAINSAGTLAVGQKSVGKSTAPVYWWRDPVTHGWHTTGVLLPTIAGAGCTSGIARGMNDAGIVVGHSCNGNKDQATVWRIDFSGTSPVVIGAPTALSGLGPSGASPISSAAGISQTAPYVIGGGASGAIVRWILPQ